ncbi:MAG: response regulator [Chloroflexota bacterium]|nr:response regulator [Chloroflexota bacterium]PLS77076.1 MAG: hypothetical protein CYG59_25775 [Chloroflexota bacterium]
MARLPRRVLLVEDDDALRNLVALVLEEEGYSVISASSGTDAITQLATNACAPDVILLDYDLVDMTAREVRAAQLG